MSESPGLGDFTHVSNVGIDAEATVAEAMRHQPHQIEATRWPGPAMALRVVVALIGIVIVIGWIVTAFNGGA
jgi:hypothetical protein